MHVCILLRIKFKKWKKIVWSSCSNNSHLNLFIKFNIVRHKLCFWHMPYSIFCANNCIPSINYEVCSKQNMLVKTVKDFRKNNMSYHVRDRLKIVINTDNLSFITEQSVKKIEVTVYNITASGISQSFFLYSFSYVC